MVSRRRSTRARPTDDDLLDAALSVFVERGFASTSMTRIAERCDSTKPTLYAHFGDKDALYQRLLDREAASCRSVLFTAYLDNADLDLRGQVEADTRALFDYAEAHPEGFALLLGGDPTVAAVQAREDLRSDVNDHIAQRVHAYLAGRDAATTTEPTGVERQLAAMLAGVALSAAQHALADQTPHDQACALAVAFSVAALANLDPTTPRTS